uniref:Musculin n=1 Tax=Pan troglodytes TaxID=9598 RepID=H2R068_PANTR
VWQFLQLTAVRADSGLGRQLVVHAPRGQQRGAHALATHLAFSPRASRPGFLVFLGALSGLRLRQGAEGGDSETGQGGGKRTRVGKGDNGMSTGSVSDPEEMELRGLQREYPVPASKRPPLRGVERSYASPSDNSSAEEEDPDGEEERCALGTAGSAEGCKRKRPRVAGGGGAGGSAGGGGKKPLPAKGSAAECKQSQRNAANARERARMRVLSKAFSRLKTSLPWVPPDTKLSKLDTLRLASSYIAHLRQLLQEDRYENGYVHPVNLTWPFVVSGRPDSDTKEVSAANRLCGTTA